MNDNDKDIGGLFGCPSEHYRGGCGHRQDEDATMRGEGEERS